MENPHEAEQAVLLERIVKNVDKCNEAVHEMNLCIREYLESSAHVDMAAGLVGHYSNNVEYNLRVMEKLTKPI